MAENGTLRFTCGHDGKYSNSPSLEMKRDEFARFMVSLLEHHEDDKKFVPQYSKYALFHLADEHTDEEYEEVNRLFDVLLDTMPYICLPLLFHNTNNGTLDYDEIVDTLYWLHKCSYKETDLYCQQFKELNSVLDFAEKNHATIYYELIDG
jgi:hypothetical protein